MTLIPALIDILFSRANEIRGLAQNMPESLEAFWGLPENFLKTKIVS